MDLKGREASLALLELRQSAELYAVGADRRDPEIWRAVLAKDCVIEGAGNRMDGLKQCLKALEMLGTMFRGTSHRVHQLVASISGSTAQGETYATADHLLNGNDAVLRWHMRYQDSWRRVGERWKFTARSYKVDWDETVAVNPFDFARTE